MRSEQYLEGRRWTFSFLVAAIGVFISYSWIDRPLSFFAHDHTKAAKIFLWMQYIPEAFPPLAAFAFIAIGLWALAKISLRPSQIVILLCSISLFVATSINNQLKFVFGRTWPETWFENISLIRDGAFGFNLFHGGHDYASFPSGHLVAVGSVMSVLWIYYPRARVLYGVCIGLVVIGLIGANYHFLSDMIAGGFLGWLIGNATSAIWQSSRK